MEKLKYISNNLEEYHHYNDYVFKRTVERRANGVLKFLNIPYTIKSILVSELTDIGPKIHRVDFAGECVEDELCLILECQSTLPDREDIKRFFQYVTSMNTLKDKKVELYILTTQEAPYNTREYVLSNDCTNTMHVISLKSKKASDILKKVEYKINHNKKISDEDIAALQLIAYTSYSEPTSEIIKKAILLINRMNISYTEKEAILYILDVISTNMLEKDERKKLLGDTKMLNPRDEYHLNEGELKGIKKIARKLLGTKRMPLKEIVSITGLTEAQILGDED